MSGDKDPLLRLLQRSYGKQWSIRRAGNLWVASARRVADHAPTLVEPDVARFVAQLEDPPPQIGHSSLTEGGIYQSSGRVDGDGVPSSGEPAT